MKTASTIHFDLANHLRGFFTTPIISFLGRYCNILDLESLAKFEVEDFSNVSNKRALLAIFNYLHTIGLLNKEHPEVFSFTKRGWEVIRRANSFYVPHSYAEYMFKIDDLLMDRLGSEGIKVDRLENVLGSGITHLRYFPPAVSYIQRVSKPEVMIDVGCGDGGFLKAVLKKHTAKQVIGVDISDLSTSTTKQAIMTSSPQVVVNTITCDATAVNVWAPQARMLVKGAVVGISMWFLLHEISRGSSELLSKFLHAVHEYFPDSKLVVGEVVRQDERILRQIAPHSLMPEYLFFHELSQQGILKWKDYQKMIDDSPYVVEREWLFDEAAVDVGSEKEPSTFLWVLTPR